MPRHMTAAEFQRSTRSGFRGRRRWSAATPTTCSEGHRHASKMEARVCVRLTLECRASGARLLQQVRFPLLSIGSKANAGDLVLKAAPADDADAGAFYNVSDHTFNIFNWTSYGAYVEFPFMSYGDAWPSSLPGSAA